MRQNHKAINYKPIQFPVWMLWWLSSNAFILRLWEIRGVYHTYSFLISSIKKQIFVPTNTFSAAYVYRLNIHTSSGLKLNSPMASLSNNLLNITAAIMLWRYTWIIIIFTQKCKIFDWWINNAPLNKSSLGHVHILCMFILFYMSSCMLNIHW